MTSARWVLVSMRPRQWTKNLIVFAPLIFSGRMGNLTSVAYACAAFVVFCLISSAVYVANDLVDIERDRTHDLKRHRPIASGQLDTRTALASAIALAALGVAGAFAIGTQFGLLGVLFLALQAAYDLWFKHEVILDVMSISAGFVIRVYAGAVAIGTGGSPWLFLCAALLALFLGLAKRRHELVLLGDEAGQHRPSLEHYSPQLIDAMLNSVTASTIIAYSLYTFFSVTGQQNPYLMLTLPFVAYGLFRYLYLVHNKNLGGSPEEILLTDVPLIVAIALWLIASGVVLYLT